MATTPDLQESQIAAAREKAWFQGGDPLLTLEAARTFVEEHGLVLFAPRPLGAPAPSLVEATLGAARPTVTPADSETARGLVARMVAEGSALPLNLLGGPGEVPDFVVSAAAFPFVFTLRGDKGWKRPPETSGAVKVTPLALRVYELLAEKGAMTVAEMVPEVGREVTDSAIVRSLNELWSLLRVIPAPQQGEGETIWELTTARFVKAVKAGANAGQPTSLSALVSLYLGQAYIATEEEIASFLSPLTARSRVRDVLHGLTAGRQLSEAVLEGKSVLFIPDGLPNFAQTAVASEELEDEGSETEADSEAADEVSEEGVEVEAAGEEGGEEGRIKRFEAGEDGGSRAKGLRGKPLARPGSAPPRPRPASDRAARAARPANDRPSSDRPKRSFSDRSGAPGGAERSSRPDRPARTPREGSAERRPRPASDRPSYNKPWEEDRNRPTREGSGGEQPARAPRGDDSRPPRREGTEGRPYRPARPREEGRPPRRDAPGADRPSFPRREGGPDRPPFRREGAPSGDRPPFRRTSGGDRPPFRREGAGGGDRPPFRREGASDRPSFPRREGGSERPSFPRREGGSERPSFPRREGGSERPSFPRREGGSDRPSFPRREGGSDRPPFRREGGGDRPSFPRREGGTDRPPFRREGGSDRPSFPRREGGGDRPPFRREGGSDRPSGARPPFGARSEGRPSRGPARPGGFGAGRPPFRSAGGDSRPSGGFSRGPSRGGDRGPAKGAPRKRPEDEA